MSTNGEVPEGNIVPSAPMDRLALLAQFYEEQQRVNISSARTEVMRATIGKLVDKFTAIKNIILELQSEGCISMSALHETLDRKIAEAEKNNDDERFRALFVAKEFIERNSGEEINAAFQTWLSARQERSRQPMNEQASRIRAAQQERAEAAKKEDDALIRRAREKFGVDVELREQQAEILREILEKGGSVYSTYLPEHYSGSGDWGGVTKTDDRRKFNDARERSAGVFQTDDNYRGIRKRLDHVMQEHGVSEGVALYPATEAVYQEKTKLIRKNGVAGFFGVTEEKKERVYSGVRAVRHEEIVSGGTQENSFYLVYYFKPADVMKMSAYQSFNDRPGQWVTVNVAIPESLAQKIEPVLHQDPFFIRKIVETIVIDKMGISQEAWEKGDTYTGGHPLRPPYEKLQEIDGVDRIYVHTYGKPFDERSIKKT